MPVNSTDIINTLRLGEVYISQNRYKDAINLFVKELSNYPNSEKIHYCLGIAYHLDNQLLNSIRSYCEAISIEPSFCEAYENLSQAQFELNLLDDALISINFAIKLNSKNARSLLKKVNILNSKNHYFEAVEIATKAINIDPKFADAYCERSNALRNLNETEKSIKDLKKAIKILITYIIEMIK